MRISELSKHSGVSTASIKFYLREGLLPAGKQTAPNQADYNDQHVRRLRLIRALIDVGGLSISVARATLATIDHESASAHDTFGAVMHGLDDIDPDDAAPDVARTYDEVREWISARDWHVDPAAPAPFRLAELVATLRRFDFPIDLNYFDDVADAAEATAWGEVNYARTRPDRASAVEAMAIGTVVIGQAVNEIRRIALEAISFRLQNTGDDSRPVTP